MRFLLLPISILAFASGPRPARVEAPTRPLVILVHGRGHLMMDSASLRREWKRDLDSALSSVGMPPLADEDLRLAWYADALDPEFESSCVPRLSESDSSGGRFVRDFFAAVASAIPKSDAPEARALLGDLMYVMDVSTRCAAEKRVGSVIESAIAEKRPVVLVAYSLGSLVTYGYLNSRAAIPVDLRLITLGSPLGNADLRELLGGSGSLSFPAGVSTWENVYDPDDVFASPIAAGLQRVQDRATASNARGGGDAHHIRRYLRDGATGAAVGRALCATAQGDTNSACRRLASSQKS